ncbi:MAG: TlpA family protein disulfide reductase [Mangrovicoccus sp.]|nr:TlpA family protein disulfide reductase [Mangrovicoccus sp.]
MLRALLIALTLMLPFSAFAQSAAPDNLDALAQGDMKKLVFHSAPKPVPEIAFDNLDGAPSSFAAYQGKIVLLNFWATWCAPCRKEMPGLDRLNGEMGSEDFTVLTLATGRNSPQAMRRFFAQEGIETLPLYKDPNKAIGSQMAVLGLPITVILDRQGREIARLQGDAEWDSDSAKAILQALIKADG